MQRIKEFIIIALCLVVISAVGTYLLFTSHQAEIWAGVSDFFSTLRLILLVVVGLVLFFGTYGAWRFINREARLIRPGKYGPAQGMLKRGGEIYEFAMEEEERYVDAAPANQLDLAAILKQHKELLQFSQTAVRAYKQLGPEEEPAQIDTEPETPAIEAPRDPDAIINLAESYPLDANEVLSSRVVILGISGSGKSNTTASYIEELARLKVPSVIADTQNEYGPIEEYLYNPALAGASGADYSLNTDNSYAFGQYVLTNGLQVILNLASYEDDNEAALVIGKIIEGMRDWQEARENERRVPSNFVLEEATKWLPQRVEESGISKEVLNTLQGIVFNDMVRQGRKNGLGFTVVAQKPAELDKRAMQSHVRILHRQNETPDLNAYKKYGIDPEETMALRDGEAFLFTPRARKVKVQIRKRFSKHGGDTPGLENLRRYHEEQKNGGANYVDSSVVFGAPANAGYTNLRNISYYSRATEEMPKNAKNGIPEETKSAITELYQTGDYTRQQVQQKLNISGEKYWMLKTVCDEIDARKERVN